MLKDGTQNVPASAANENTLFHVVPSRCTRTLGPCNKVAHKLTPCTHTHTHTHRRGTLFKTTMCSSIILFTFKYELAD